MPGAKGMTRGPVPDVARLALFSSMTDEELRFVAQRLRASTFQPGEVLLAKGEIADALYVVVTGLAGVSLAEAGQPRRDIAVLGPGECAGEMSILTSQPCSATVQALVPTEVVFLDAEAFAEAFQHCPSLWRNLGAILRARLVRTNERLAGVHAARFSSLQVLSGSDRGRIAWLTGASLARQSRRAVMLADLSGEGAVWQRAEAEGARLSPEALTGLPMLEKWWDEDAPPLRVVRAAGLAGDAEPGSDPSLMEELRRRYDEVVVTGATGDPGRDLAWRSQVESTVIVTTALELARASELAAGSAGRLEVALATDTEVESDNGVGGLWDRRVLQERSAALAALAGSGAPLRLIPRDDGRSQAFPSGGNGWTREESPFRQALDRLARRLGRMEVGVALGAGMAKGFSHIGVLRALKAAGVPVDYLVGTSIGSIVASVYAGGMETERLRELMEGADKRFVRPTLPIRSISSNRGLQQILTGCHERAPTAEFPELFIPLAVVAADYASGHEVVLREGVVWKSVLASVSMPGIFPPVMHEGRVMVDGGVVNPVPARTARAMGADIVIGVDLAASATGGPARGKPRLPNIIENLWRTTEIMLGEISSRSEKDADVTLRPSTGHSRIRDFSRRGAEFLTAGEQAVKDALPELAQYIPTAKSGPGVKAEV